MNNKHMNKFYEKYKDLFPLPENKSYSNSYLKQNYHDYSVEDFVNFGQYQNKKSMQIPKQNQFKHLFKRYAKNQIMSKFQSEQNQSPATKQFSNVVLPRLKFLSRQLNRKVSRFRTQNQISEQTMQNKSMIQNSYSPLINQNKKQINLIKDDLQLQRNFYINKNNRYKHADHLKYQYQNHNIFSQPSDTLNFQTKKLSFEPSKQYSKKYQNQLSFNVNPEEQTYFANQNQSSNNKRYETEYQRSYSNEKLPKPQMEEKLEKIELQIKPKANFHVDTVLNAKKRRIHTEQTPNQENQLLKLNSLLGNQQKNTILEQNKTEESPYRHNQPSYKNSEPFSKSSYKIRNSPMRKTTKSFKNEKQERVLIKQEQKQEGLSFSQYSNQYAFINKRLSDIKQFNNYYHHTVINSYKKAIIRRIEAKRSQEIRKNKLRYLLTKESINYNQ